MLFAIGCLAAFFFICILGNNWYAYVCGYIFFSAPSGSPSNFQARALDSRSIHLSWDPLPLAQRNGIIRNYRVTILNIAGDARVINTTATSVNVTALNPFTIYTCTVAAETIAVGPSTSPIEIVTPPDGKH